jgi:hypothetical protein
MSVFWTDEWTEKMVPWPGITDGDTGNRRHVALIIDGSKVRFHCVLNVVTQVGLFIINN